MGYTYRFMHRQYQVAQEDTREKGGYLLLALILGVIASGGIAYVVFTEKASVIPLGFVVFFGVAMAVAGLPWQTASDRLVRLRLAATVYFASVIVVIIVYYILQFQYGMPYLGVGGSDDLVYEMRAATAAQRAGISNFKQFSHALGAKYAGYYYLIAILQMLGNALGGYHTILPRLLNSLCLSVIAVLVYELGKMCHLSRKASLAAAYLIGVFPLLAFFAATVVRDIIITLLLIFIAYLTIRLAHARGPRQFAIISVTMGGVLVIIWTFRSQSALACVGAVVITLIGWIRRRNKANWGWVGLVSLVAMAFVLRDVWKTDLIDPIKMIDYYSAGRSSITDSEGLSQFIWRTPAPLSYFLRAAYGLVSPLPLGITNPLSFYQGLGTMIWIILMPFAFLQMRTAVRDPGKLTLLAFWAIFFIGLTQTTFVFRQFVQFYPFVLLLAVDGFEHYHRYRVPVFGLTFLTVGLFSSVYLVLKW